MGNYPPNNYPPVNGLDYEGRFFRPWWFYGFPTTVPADAAAPTTTTTTTTDDATIKSTSNHLDDFGNLKPSPSKTLNP